MPYPVAQIAYFVSDIRSAASRFSASFGAGPFHVMDRIPLAKATHRGTPCDFLHSSAYGQWGDVMVEFVQQDIEGPSPFRDLYAPGEEGLHHTASIVSSLDEGIADLASQGFELATHATTQTGTDFVFVDAVNPLGHMIELYEGTEPLLGFYAFIREAARNWDGKEPVREIG